MLLAWLQAKQRHALLQQEHLQLQQKHRSYVFQIAFAKDSQQNIQELQAEVNDLQEELSILQGDHNRYWVEKRQLVSTNSNLTQVCLATCTLMHVLCCMLAFFLCIQ